ncbi:protein SFI1 homolog isoform X2 [Mesocricetus auratus]|uniref:Protein SFI1 homolog isoform X2 n=1 Tax=Mesocricetus auratus TaxID=10036 RepID=A0ABM2XNY9_MESAU|nr:protein SFI1 homolog isoform X2 [Mesocricetus auratus]
MEKKIDSRSFRDGVVKKPCSRKALPLNRSAFSGVQKGSPRSCYSSTPASHSWTRHRLRELRSRCVARKFLYLWIRMTFGRVTPSRARLFHEQRILQKVFGEWREEWWVSQREWKLCVRADCHYRYYLYSLMFKSWKTFVHQQQELRKGLQRAERHDTKQKIRQAWKSWLIYMVARRTKRQMQNTALEFRRQSVLRFWWRKWRWRLGQAHADRALLAAAVKHRALSLQLQAWSRWQEQLLNRRRESWKVVTAVRHHQRWQKQRSWKAWLEYLHICRVKRRQSEMAAKFHRVTVLQIYFCDWQWAWEWRQSLSAHQALVEKLAKKIALRRAFAHWKHFMLLQAEEAAQHAAAAEHHRHYLLCSCFRALKDNVTQAHLWRIRRNLAHQLRDTTLLRRFWNLWQSRIEQREERVRSPSLHAAWSHYRVIVLRKCVRVWLRYVHKRRQQQLLQARADGHFQQRVLPAAFCMWYRLWRWNQQSRVLHTRAVSFHRETLERRVFAVWWQKMSHHRENRLAERMAVLQAEQQLLRRSWLMWHRQAAACHQERDRQTVACVHYHNRLLRKAFCVWKGSAQGFRTERMGRARAVHFHSARLLHWAWSVWNQCLALRMEEQQKLRHAALHSQHTLLYGALQKWLTFQDRVRSVLQEVAARERQHNRQLLRRVLRRWRENTMARVHMAKKTSQARAQYSRTLCAKVLVQWREVTSMQIYYREKEAAALREAQKALGRGRLRNWFQRWQVYSHRAAQQRSHLEQAALYHRQQLLKEAMARWRAHHLGCVRKKRLQQQSAQLLAQRLGRACFCQWRTQLAARKQEQWSTARALWFWAFSLQAKVWTAWLRFIFERRRKKARLEQAVEAYHRQLLQEGTTRLLRFAAGMKASRQQLQTQQQVQAAHSLHRAVRHCAELWKKKVLGPGMMSQPPAPIPLSRRVTFKDSILSGVAAEAGDAALETKKLQAPPSQGILGSLAVAAGEPCWLELNEAHVSRKQPRRPSFLLERLENQRSPGWCILGEQQLEKPPEKGQSMAPPRGLSLTRPFPPVVLPNAPGSSAGLELLPPLSFMPHGVGESARGSAKPVVPGHQPLACPALTKGPKPHLFIPGDFTSTRIGPDYGFEATGQGTGVTFHQSPPSLLGGSEGDGRQDQTYLPVAAGHTKLEAELEGIQQQLQHYQTTKQNLRSCQRQANSLRRWLELSQEEPRPEDWDLEQQVKRELEEVELEIQQLSEELQAQRQPIGTCIARVRALRQALC